MGVEEESKEGGGIELASILRGRIKQPIDGYGLSVCLSICLYPYLIVVGIDVNIPVLE